MKNQKWLLPTVLDPPDSVCVQIQVPNDPAHIAAFWGSMNALKYAWNWDDSMTDGSTVAFVWAQVIENAVQASRDGTSCMIDCEEVEDCIETSPTIINIETETTTNTTNISILDSEVEELDTTDGNEYPPAPDEELEPDAACGAAFNVISELRSYINEVEASATTFTSINEALLFYLGSLFTIIFNPLAAIITALFSGSPPPSVLPDYDAQLNELRELLYCDTFDKDGFSNLVVANITGGAAIGDFIDSIGYGTWAMWISIGALDDTQDCTSFPCVGTIYNIPATGNGFTGGGGIFSLMITVGQTVTVEYTDGTWDYGTGWSGGAEGDVGETNPLALIPASPLGSLVLREAGEVTWDFVGTSLYQYVASGTALMYITMNDRDAGFADNGGSINVRITVT